ncbi:MAG: hypothetical protein AB7S52_12175 [Sphaerochaetaceae bacterium]
MDTTGCKQIVCYGDSNTWGFTPATGERMPYGQRWTSIVAEKLGAGYRIIPEGLNGRTTVFEDPVEAGRNGLEGNYFRGELPKSFW